VRRARAARLAASGRTRALRPRFGGLSLLVATLAGITAALALAGCGAGAAEAPSQPFGAPPQSAPGVHAWAAGEVGTLLVTADGGATWRRQKFFLSERGVDVAFADARAGWLVTDAGAVLVTTDGGAAWKVADKVALQMKAVAAADAQHAWVVGATGGATEGPGTSVVRSTADGGATWAERKFGDAQLVDIAFSDARHGVLIALDRIWTTSNGGRAWKLRRQLGMTVLTCACAGDARHAWVAGWGTQDGAPLVYTTSDGGVSWRRLTIDVPVPSADALQARQIAAAGAAHLWVTCAAGVLATQDGGKTWALQKVAAGRPQAIAAADEQHLVATTTGQPVLATADGGQTWPAWGRDGLLEQPLVAVSAALAPAGQ
jgi:photosystem II stability/assembly factor-like uncharacterized protein